MTVEVPKDRHEVVEDTGDERRELSDAHCVGGREVHQHAQRGVNLGRNAGANVGQNLADELLPFVRLLVLGKEKRVDLTAESSRVGRR